MSAKFKEMGKRVSRCRQGEREQQGVVRVERSRFQLKIVPTPPEPPWPTPAIPPFAPLTPDSAHGALCVSARAAFAARTACDGILRKRAGRTLKRDRAEVEQATAFRGCPRASAVAVATRAVAATIPGLSIDHEAARTAAPNPPVPPWPPRPPLATLDETAVPERAQLTRSVVDSAAAAAAPSPPVPPLPPVALCPIPTAWSNPTPNPPSPPWPPLPPIAWFAVIVLLEMLSEPAWSRPPRALPCRRCRCRRRRRCCAATDAGGTVTPAATDGPIPRDHHRRERHLAAAVQDPAAGACHTVLDRHAGDCLLPRKTWITRSRLLLRR